MKKTFFVLFLFSFFLKYNSFTAPLSVGFAFGLSTPNSQINNVYNSDKINLNNNLWNVARESAKIGYHLGVNLNLPLSDNFNFRGAIALNRFPQSELKLFFPQEPYDTVILKTIQNIIPISAGIDLYVTKSFVSPYISGNLSYFYIVNSIDIVKLNQELPIATSRTDSRIGAGLGLGFDFDIGLIILKVEAKYWFVNLIGNTAGEQDKNFLSFGVGITFGGM